MSTSDGEAESAWADLSSEFDRSTRTHRSILTERFYVFGGGVARIRVVGLALADLFDRPFAHLRLENQPIQEPDLKIDLVDASETGIPCKLRSSPLVRGHMSSSADGHLLVQERESIKSAFDRREGRIVSLVADAAFLPLSEHSSPLHLMLLLWHRDRGLPMAHAGLVAIDGSAVLLGGPGGAGKSTVSLCCLLDGFSYLSDDYVALEALTDGTFVGHGLYATARVVPDHLKRFPQLHSQALKGTRPEEDKNVVQLAAHFSNQLKSSARIRALVLPRVCDGQETIIRPATKTEALLRLAPSSVLQLPLGKSGRDSFDHLARMIESVPTFWMELGPDLGEIPKRVRGILAEASTV